MPRSSTFLPAALALAVFGTGCALIVNGKRQSLNINSTPAGAEVIIDGTSRGKSPVLMDLARDASHTVKIRLEGYQPFELTLQRKVSGWVWGNILFGGLIGLIVDASTGAMYKLTPEQVSATLAAAEAPKVGRLPGDGLVVGVTLRPDPAWQKVGQLAR